MERFTEVWSKIISKFQEVLNTIFAVFDGIGGLIGGDE